MCKVWLANAKPGLVHRCWEHAIYYVDTHALARLAKVRDTDMEIGKGPPRELAVRFRKT